MMTSFKVDENLPSEATLLLKEAGYDTLSVHDQELVGSTDSKLADICKTERRAIVTLDLDFADIREYPPASHFGIIVLRLARQDKPHVLDVLSSIVQIMGSEELSGKLWIVNEQTIRIRD